VTPIPYDDLRRFFRVDGWTCVSRAPGRTTRKHEVWTKSLPGGESLRAVVSKGRGAYSRGLADHILKHELRVSEREFRAAVRDRAAPSRPGARTARPEGEPLPLSLVRALLAAGHAAADVRGLSLVEAKRLLRRGRA